MTSALGESAYRALFEYSMDGVLLTVPNGGVVAANPAACAMFGRTEEEICRLGRSQLVDVSDPRLQPALEERARTGKARAELTLFRADGSRFAADVTSALFTDAAGNVRTAMIIRDVTQYKRIEAELAASHDVLEQRVEQRTAELALARDKLAALVSKLTIAEEEERRDIAMELHDHLSQLLVAAKIKLGLLQEEERSAADARALGEVRSIIEQADQSVRSLTFQIDPHRLLESGLVAALEELAPELRKLYGLAVAIHADGVPANLAPTVLSTLYRASRELLINVAKHAKTASAHLDITTHEDLLVVSVTDYGVGFDATRVTRSARSGYGLPSIRERLQLIGGEFAVDTQPGEGTTATLTVPLAIAAEAPIRDGS